MERFLPELKDQHPQLYYEHVHRYILAKEHVRGGRVLDLACGEGYGSKILAENAEHVVGIDLSTQAIQNAKEKIDSKNIEFIVADCCNTQLDSSSYDYIVSFETIEHLSEPDKFIKEISRLIKPDGLLIISSPDKLEYRDKTNNNNPYHEKEFYHSEFRSLLKSHFKHCILGKQRLVAGSLILADKADSQQTETGVYYGDHSGNQYRNELPEGVYSVAFCSNAEIAKIKVGIFENKLESAIAWDSREKIGPINAKVQSLESDLKQQSIEYRDNEKRLDDIAASADQLKVELSRSIRSYADQVQENSSSTKQSLEALQIQVQGFSDHIERLEEEVREKALTIEDLQIKLESSRSSFRQETERLKESQKEDLRELAARQSSELQLLETACKEKDNRIIDLQNKSANAIAGFEKEMQALKREITQRHTEETERLKSDLASLQKANEKTSKELGEASTTIEALRVQVRSILIATSDIEKQNEAAQKEITSNNETIDVLSRELALANSKITEHSQAYSILEEELQTTRRMLREKTSEWELENLAKRNIEARYERLKTTFSWRVTVPFRAARRTIERIFGK